MPIWGSYPKHRTEHEGGKHERDLRKRRSDTLWRGSRRDRARGPDTCQGDWQDSGCTTTAARPQSKSSGGRWRAGHAWGQKLPKPSPSSHQDALESSRNRSATMWNPVYQATVTIYSLEPQHPGILLGAVCVSSFYPESTKTPDFQKESNYTRLIILFAQTL